MLIKVRHESVIIVFWINGLRNEPQDCVVGWMEDLSSAPLSSECLVLWFRQNKNVVGIEALLLE